MSDIRLATSFRGHRKRKRLTRILGKGATDHLIDLWLSVAESCPTGKLSGWDDIDIADAAGWEEEPSLLVQALIDCRFLDLTDGIYQLHGWEDHQSWVVGAPARKKAAQQAAKARWNKRNRLAGNAKSCAEHEENNAESCEGQCDPHAEGNAPFLSYPNLTYPNKKHSPSSEVESAFDVRANFEKAWKAYPRKQGKKEALCHFRASVKDTHTAERFMSALANYKAHIEAEKIEPRFIKSGSTFFNNWQDEVWSNPPTESMPDQFKGAI